jgi:O-methyltransferase
MNRPVDIIRKTARTAVPEGVRRRLRGVAQPATPDLMASAHAASLVTPLNLHLLHELVQRLGRLGIEGDIVECGVYRGGSAAVLGSAMLGLGDDPPRKLWLFDSFAGMPPAGDEDGEFSHTLEGTYVGSEEQTRALLEQAAVPPRRFEIVTGFYADTFPTVKTPRTALLHVDCDFYEPVKLTLEKFFPRLSPGGFVVLNDYGIYKGARTATDEYFEVRGLDIDPVAIDPTASFFQKPGDGYSGLPVAGHFPGYPGAVA